MSMAMEEPGAVVQSHPLGMPSDLAFKSLKPLELGLDDALPSAPIGVVHGTLSCGLTYYVRQNPKPMARAALALGVKIGSVLEEDDERGVAHILEHLAFSATKKYTNHDIIKFLESIGAEFGACQNAMTSADETVYELLVPVDKPGILSQAISVLAEFSAEIRASDEDLQKERGAVLEEYRQDRNATGRMQEAHWMLMMEGSKYADRLPIGLEKVIRTVPAKTVENFYNRWYHPRHMTIIAVGDFPDTQVVVDLIKEHFEEMDHVFNRRQYLELPIFPVPYHEEPRFSCFAEREAGGTAVFVSCKIPSSKLVTLRDYQQSLTEGMFHSALNQRLFKISRQQNSPFFQCLSVDDSLVRPVKAYTMTASCKENGTLEALESMLIEVARIRLHGFSEREIAMARSLIFAEMESAFLERDQVQSTNFRDEYLEHFLRNEPVVGIEYEARLQKSVLPGITPSEVAKVAHSFRTSYSCVIKTVEPRVRVTVKDLKAVVAKVQELEEKGEILPWIEDHVPEEVVAKKPEPGFVKETKEYPECDATELLLSNGMRICYKSTDFLDDQILIGGFAYGGVSEVPQSEFRSCSMGSNIAGEIGVYGHKPSVLLDILAGKRAEVACQIGAYMRTFSGDCSPSDLEVALQLIYQLFVTDVHPEPEEVKQVMQMTKEAINARERDPLTAFANRVREINYGKQYYMKPFTVQDLRKIDPIKACDYFNKCFKDPSTFTVVIVGKLCPKTAIPLILQYLGGIPVPAQPVMKYDRDALQGLPFTFPARVVREEVRKTMVEAQGSVQITFPVELQGPRVLEDVPYMGFFCKLLETKMMQILRFKHGQVYSVYVSYFLGGSKPSRTGDVCGDISIGFSCDPESAWNLVNLSLDELTRMQKEGPRAEDVSTVLELEQRGFENGLQENTYWLDKLLRSYQSRIYEGNLAASFQAQDQWRHLVREQLTESTMLDALCRLIPTPCAGRYTAVALVPREPFLKRMFSFVKKRDHKMVIAVSGAAMCVFMVLWRYKQKP